MDLTYIFKSTSRTESASEEVCKWILDNFEKRKNFILPRYPYTKEFLPKTGMIILNISIIMVLVIWMVVHQKQNTKVIVNAQYQFICFLLAGCLLISTGSLFMTFPTNNMYCIISEWLINLGYTLEFMPLLAKMATINHMLNCAKQRKETGLNELHLLKLVVRTTVLMVVYMMIWTVIDSLQKKYEYIMAGLEKMGPHKMDRSENSITHKINESKFSSEPIMLEESYVTVQAYCKLKKIQ